MTPEPEVPVAYCYRHPGRETGVRCVRCDRPICPDCMRPASVGFQCPDDVKLGRTRPTRTLVGARAGQFPFVTVGLVVAILVVYAATALPSPRGINYPYLTRLFQDWELIPFSVAENGQFGRLVTSAFLHVGLWHLVANTLALGFIGPALERYLGWWRFAALYGLSALGGSLAIYVFGGEFTPVAGASGAIFGLFAAMALMTRRLNIDPQWIASTLILNAVVTFTVPNISLLGHAGGFVAGCLATLAIIGDPRGSQRVPVRLQAAGLGALAVLILVGVVLRTAAL